MLVEGGESIEFAGAEITFVRIAIPCTLGSFVGGRPLPSDQFLRDQTVVIYAAYDVVHGVTAETGCLRTGSRLQVMCETCGCRERRRAVGTADGRAQVDSRVQVLIGRVVARQPVDCTWSSTKRKIEEGEDGPSEGSPALGSFIPS